MILSTILILQTQQPERTRALTPILKPMSATYNMATPITASSDPIDSSMEANVCYNAVGRRSQNITLNSTEYDIKNNVCYDVVENIKSI